MFNPAEIEEFLLPYRIGRRLVCAKLLEFVSTEESLGNPFLILSRLFVRLKSSDSILEKIQRKKLDISSVPEIGQVMHDLLGFRIITETLDELWVVDRHLTANFEVKSRNEKIDPPGQYGSRSIEYALIYHDRDIAIPFEIQLRTMLQHYWSTSSFHLFHKAPPEKARAHEVTLIALSDALNNAEHHVSTLVSTKNTCNLSSRSAFDLEKIPLTSEVQLVVVEPGECFAKHVRLKMTGIDQDDHKMIVEQKLALYAEHPNSAIVEYNSMSFLTFTLNEPHVIIPIAKMDQIDW